jgi:hypothetical protein
MPGENFMYFETRFCTPTEGASPLVNAEANR